MTPLDLMPALAERFELRFEPMRLGRPLAFDCDAAGAVDLDALSEAARRDYLYAHTLIGRDYTSPIVQRVRRALASSALSARPAYIESRG